MDGWRSRLDNGSARVSCQTSPREEGLTMSDRASTPGSSGNDLSASPGRLDEAREAAMMREIIRNQERHREGGAEPELDAVDGDSASGA
jgi:hypothetical protein